MRENFDSLFNGINFGIIAPILGCGIIYLAQFSGISFDKYITFISELSILPKMIGLSTLANLLLFFICIWLKMDKAARGIMISTFLYGGIILILIMVNWIKTFE